MGKRIRSVKLLLGVLDNPCASRALPFESFQRDPSNLNSGKMLDNAFETFKCFNT